MEFKVGLPILLLITFALAQQTPKLKFSSRLVAKTFSHQQEANLVFSPFSALANVGLLYQAASGRTYRALSSALGFSNSKNFSELFHKIATSLNHADGVTLTTANKIYAANKFKLDATFAEIASGYFCAEAENVDFSPQTARKINYWVESKTQGKIAELVSPDDFDELTAVVLLNAIYFKSEWRYKFNELRTSKSEFFSSDNDAKRVDMMQLRANVGYGEDSNLDATLLELPYKNWKLSMVIVLPNKRSGIVELERKLLNLNIDDVISNMEDSPVLVTLPKFKFDSVFDLKQPLSQMGLEEIFTTNANLSRMLDNRAVSEGLFVSKMVQKAFIEVNEEGAEAAAATASVVQTRQAGAKFQKTYTFTADHPFLFFIIYRQKSDTGILFAGRIKQL